MTHLYEKSLSDVKLLSISDIQSGLIHADLSLSSDWMFSLKRNDARSDETQYWCFDFKEAWLPPNALFPYSQKFIERPELVNAAVLVIQQYFDRCTNSKTRTERARFILNTTILAIEYLWLNDIISLRAAPPESLVSLPEKVACGGWTHALKINERIETVNSSLLKLLLESQKGFNLHKNTQKEIRQAIGSNCRNLFELLKQQDVNDNLQLETSTDSKYALSTIRDILGVINYLFDIGPEYGLSFLPFPKPERLASKLGRAESRTENMPTDVAAQLLKQSVLWVHKYGPVIVELLEDISIEVARCKGLTRKWTGRRLKTYFDELEKRKAAANVLPFSIDLLDFGRLDKKGKYTLREAILCVMSACFIVIAGMNARRKDEIVHKKFGLRRGDLRVVSQELDLYEMDFYVEKTYKKRMPFYVNKTTAEAVKLLERIEEAFHSIDIAIPADDVNRNSLDERTLFSYRRFSVMKGVGKERKWYDFTLYSHDSDALKFVDLALPLNKGIRLHAHMFRRMYALIFYYQYENADLQALSHQLGHWSLESTLIYITDPSSRTELEVINSVMDITSTEIQKARIEHFQNIQEDLLVVGYEKLAQDVYDILTGGQYAGGYAKYIRRIHYHLSQVIRFDISAADGGDAVVKVVKKRGHFPRPMKHGLCMVGNSLSTKSAHCASKDTGEIQKEQAGVITCSNCMFHLTSIAYLSNIEEDLGKLISEAALMKEGSVMHENVLKEIAGLQKATNQLRQRLIQKSPAK